MQCRTCVISEIIYEEDNSDMHEYISENMKNKQKMMYINFR